MQVNSDWFSNEKSVLTCENVKPELQTHALRHLQSGSYYADVLRITPLDLGNSKSL